jgi:hypothetical protein
LMVRSSHRLERARLWSKEAREAGQCDAIPTRRRAPAAQKE